MQIRITDKQKRYYFGLFAELTSYLYLSFKFYKIIDRRFKSPFGEIDLIAKKGNHLIFIEVKDRKNTSLMDFIPFPIIKYTINNCQLTLQML